MKKHIFLFAIAILSCLQLSAQSSNNASPKHEFRATWCATVTNIDWPTTKVTKVTDEASRTAQQKELTDILDALQAGNINAVCLQVRSLCDALYESSYEPWAACLTGERGKNPGYDPLQFAIEECHKRGMELHVWINPYRVTSEKLTTGSNPYSDLPADDKLYTHGESHLSDKVIKYQNGEKYGQVLDPGYPEVREHIVKVLQEIVTNYDIDGMLMDDYFYPTGADDYDAASQALYFTPNEETIVDFNENGSKLDDWRRSNVDQMVRDVYQMIQTKKPWVRFGMGPFGIWSYGEDKATEKYGLVHPQGIRGANYYTERGCNTVEWIKQGWVDYVCPQLYWPTNQAALDYNVLYEWWSGVCEKFSTDNRKVHFYPSPNAGRVYGADGHKWGIAEMKLQLNQGREKLTNGYSGAVFYSVRYYLNLDYLGNPICGNDVTTTMCEDLKASHFQQKALVPPMTWKSTEELDAPTTLRINGKTLTWAHDNAERFTVYIYPKGVRMSQAIEDVNYLQGVVYGTEFTLPNSFNSTTHNVAVRSYDRYGVEHEAAEYGPDVTYVLNGGVVEKSTPTNAELWEQFKTAFNEFNGLNKVDQPITNCGAFTYTSSGTPCLDMLTSAESGWKWLGDYLVKTATAAGKTCATNAAFRWNLDAFFNAYAGKNDAVGVDYTTAGQPSAWGSAYLAAHSNTNVEPQPTNAELWTSFKKYFNEYYPAGSADPTAAAKACSWPRSDLTKIENVATFWAGNIDASANIMTNANSEYKWLGDYISSVVSAQGKAALSDESAWRWAVHAFFNAEAGKNGATGIDFTTAGQPTAWKAAWDAAHTTSADPETSTYTLPDFIETALTLPTEDSRPVYITHPSGYRFAGWIDGNGNSIASLPADYKGIVYAQWGADITWVLNGGVYTGKGELPLHVHDTYILPTAFAMRKDGHKFVGWYASSDFQGEKLITINSGVGTLYAKWEPATPVTWHPYPYYDVTNEDLWELFIEDYNAFYNSDILGENRSYENRAHQPIGNVFGFMHSGEKLKNANGEWINKEGDVVGTEAAAHHRFPDGRAMDFMTHPQSPWKWLGDYVVETIEAGKSSEDSNEPLWSAFKEATGLTNLSTLKNYEENGNGFTSIAGELKKEDYLTTLFADEKWACLKSYIMTVQNEKKNQNVNGVTVPELKNTISDSEAAWRYAVAAFFLQNQQKSWPYSYDFSEAGKHTIWMEAIEQMGTEAAEEFHELGHFRISSEKEWRKQIAGFFNHSDFIKYVFPVGSKDSILEETADFRNFGLPKPNGDPAAGWYNAWWNATFPEYMINNEALPKIKRKNYVFGGWYYGNDKGYIFTEGTKADPDAYSSANNYKNHLWGRWLELCLYEGYVDSDPAALDANEQPISPKVNNNVEMVICNAEEIDRTKLSRKVDVERKLIGGTYNTMFLPFGINGAGGKVDDVQMNGKEYYLRQVVDDNGNSLLDPETTSILVYEDAKIENIGGEEVIAFNFHEYADNNSDETLLAYQPFLIKPANDITVRMHFWSALMQAPANAGARTTAAQAFVEGVLAPTVIPVNPEGDNTLILVADNRLAKVTTQGEMLGLRLYFTVPKDVSPSARSIIRVNNAPAGIDDIETPQQGAAVIKIMQNGNIYILRGNEIYTITGNRVK